METKDQNFTRSNLSSLFLSYREPNMVSMVEDTQDLLKGLQPPNVEVFCIHSRKVGWSQRDGES